MKIKKGDTVMVRVGKDKGRTGTVTAVLPKEQRVIVDGVNIRTRHLKPTRTNPQGGVVKEPKAIHVAKVGLPHPSDKKRTSRVGFELDKKGEKKRVYRQAGNKEVK